MDPAWIEALRKVSEAAEAVRRAAEQGGQGEVEAGKEALRALADTLAQGDTATREREQRQAKALEQYHSGLQTKLDKITRQLDALAESQAKTNKVGNDDLLQVIRPFLCTFCFPCFRCCSLSPS